MSILVHSGILTVDLALEQHGFELHRSTYVWVFYGTDYKCTFCPL